VERLLIVGAGDIARRALPALLARYEVAALVRGTRAPLAGRGVRLLDGDLDRPETLAAVAARAEACLHLAPPGESGVRDERTRNLVTAFAGARMLPRRLVYISTSGVYGDCGGARVDESRLVRPQTDRARRRVDAEQVLLDWGRGGGVEIVVLRVPGIYAADRLPLERLKRRTPVLRAEDDVYTNHVHADDLAAICARALEGDAPAGVYNAADDTEMKTGDYFDLVADRFGLARPPRVSRAEAERVIPPTLASFMRESRRLENRKLKEQLGIRLMYPTVLEGVPIRVFAPARHDAPLARVSGRGVGGEGKAHR
jgi:nucleoside-diphosphate-sugar epimerase